VISIFAIRLAEIGIPNCESLMPLTFQVIIGTVAIYGITAPFVARWLKVARPDPQGVLFAGAQPWVRKIASALKAEGFRVAMVDSNWGNITAARSDGLTGYYANILSENLLHDIQLDGIGRLLALIPNDEVNSLAALHFEDIFGRSEVYQLPPSGKSSVESRGVMPIHLRGRFLFDKKATCDYLEARFQAGAVVKRNSMTEEFDFAAFKSKYGQDALPMFVITESGNLRIWTATRQLIPGRGEKLISIVDEPDEDEIS
jgi:hypothetical protein